MTTAQTKRCTKCGETKALSEFSKAAFGAFGVRGDCKVCRAVVMKNWRAANAETVKLKAANYYADNRHALLSQQAAYYAENSETIAAKRAVRKSQADPDLLRQRNHAYYRNRVSTPSGRLAHSLRSRMSAALRRGSKFGRKAFDLLNYTAEDLRSHLEAQFTEGMSWDNYGSWHVDHIVPLAALQSETPDDADFKFAWSLKNLQPLWALDNIRKNAKTAFRRESDPTTETWSIPHHGKP